MRRKINVLVILDKNQIKLKNFYFVRSATQSVVRWITAVLTSNLNCGVFDWLSDQAARALRGSAFQPHFSFSGHCSRSLSALISI